MKKLLCLVGALSLVFASCSSEEENNSENGADAILPKTVKYTDTDFPSDNATYVSTYSDTKVLSVKNEYGRTDYTYDGDFIVKEVNYDTESDSNKDVKSDETTYKYSNGKLSESSFVESFSTEYPNGKYKNRKVYTHNVDGTVKVETYKTNPEIGPEYKSIVVSVLTFANGNLVKSVDAIAETNNVLFNNVYEYDTKNNPFKNILGFNLLIGYNGIEGSMSSVNNIIKYTTSYGDVTEVYKREFIYDANGYPTKISFYKNDGITVDSTNEYTY